MRFSACLLAERGLLEIRSPWGKQSPCKMAPRGYAVKNRSAIAGTDFEIGSLFASAESPPNRHVITPRRPQHVPRAGVVSFRRRMRRDTRLCCIIATQFGSYRATLAGKLTWVPSRLESASLSNQSGIESCRVRFTDLNRRPRRKPMRCFNKTLMRFGASLLPTRRKATYLVLRRIGITYQLVSEASSSTRLLIRRKTPEAPLTRAGTMELMAFYSEPTLREQFALQSRYQGSLMGSHKLIDGTLK
jgi:hypothetical protein